MKFKITLHSGLYFFGRTASGRPTLQHILGSDSKTYCGIDVSNWTKVFEPKIPLIFCKNCERIKDID